MSGASTWQDEKYRQVFEEETRGLERRFASGSCSIRDIESQLRHLYIQEGNDQTGRGAVGDIAIAAAVAAYERFIFQRKTGEAS